MMKVRKLSTPSLWVTTLIRLWLPLAAVLPSCPPCCCCCWGDFSPNFSWIFLCRRPQPLPFSVCLSMSMPLPYMLSFTGTSKIQNKACWTLNEGSVDFFYISWVSWVLADIMTRVSLLHFQKWNRNSGQSILADYYVLIYTFHHQKVDEVYGQSWQLTTAVCLWCLWWGWWSGTLWGANSSKVLTGFIVLLLSSCCGDFSAFS